MRVNPTDDELRAARHSAVKSRSAAIVQLGALIITAAQALRDQLASARTIRGNAALCRRLRPSTDELCRPAHAAKFALRSIAQRIGALDDEIAVLDRQLEALVRVAAPRTIQLLGISTGHAGRLLVTAGESIERLRGEGAFAALCGASPVPASSGKTTRHRLNYGGDRQANRRSSLGRCAPSALPVPFTAVRASAAQVFADGFVQQPPSRTQRRASLLARSLVF